MATASVTNTFVNATPAVASEVNQNFTELVTFANGSTVHVDGSKAMTAALDAGSNKIVNLSTGTASTDAVNVGQMDTAIAAGVPTGTIAMWSTGSAPTGWLLADGTAVSRSTYSVLFGVIGTTFGVGDGSTTFNLPNFQDRFPVGVGADADSFADSLAATGGAQDAVVPQHNHTASTGNQSASHTHSDGSFKIDTSTYFGASQGFLGTGSAATNDLLFDGGSINAVTWSTADLQVTGTSGNQSANHNHAVTVDNEGVSVTNANLPPYLAINFIIKTGA